jgi:hypothetical protein
MELCRPSPSYSFVRRPQPEKLPNNADKITSTEFCRRTATNAAGGLTSSYYDPRIRQYTSQIADNLLPNNGSEINHKIKSAMHKNNIHGAKTRRLAIFLSPFSFAMQIRSRNGNSVNSWPFGWLKNHEYAHHW